LDDLIAWLRAQLDDDERVARAAVAHAPGRWVPMYRDVHAVVLGNGTHEQRHVGTAESGELATFLSDWSPARVLAEVDAKRRRLDWLAARQHDMGPEGFPTYDSCRLLVQPGELGDLEVGYCSCGLDGWRNQLYRFEALPYADRPGYQESWRP
jgi:hypothetical protein